MTAVKITEADGETFDQLSRVVSAYNRSILKGREKAPGKTRRPSVRLFDLDSETREVKYLPSSITLAEYSSHTPPTRGTEPGQIADQGALGDPALLAVIQPVKVRKLKLKSRAQQPAPESDQQPASRRGAAVAGRKRAPRPVQTD